MKKHDESDIDYINRISKPHSKEVNDRINFDEIPKITELGPRIKPKKQPVTLRLDIEIIDFFKSHGHGYQTKINKILLAYVNSQTTESIKGKQPIIFNASNWNIKEAQLWKNKF